MAAPRLSPEEPTTTQRSHYEILGLSPAMLNDSSCNQDPSPLIKRAYHRALLRNHPDKAKPAPPPLPPRQSTAPIYTVDQIGQAFAVLSSPARRAAYDASIRLSLTRPGSAPAHFHTGVENVDLDDLLFDDDEQRWSRSCRCGNDRGYSFDEADLMDAADDGLLMVGCQDCSLWLRVHFAVVEDAEPSAPENSTT
ncbi:CSL zinc finger domain-containing protein [Hirsutella rhossiliensis]|uniref:Diphthamide biosynthesis protein 4 n=1 Tax=Hirsutella rhossiliensis TaxID=111463 RepID=A0A9P8MXQ2_9HYPO|nr:CSL zinc finger domain-containing protein [Hirsutella rhossiliensis]KAH0963150.1 CSL zinc finger domain-containing protein [Hirsutella rhossiliensis]